MADRRQCVYGSWHSSIYFPFTSSQQLKTKIDTGKDKKQFSSLFSLPPVGYLNVTLSLHNVHEDALTVPESSGEQWWMTKRKIWWREQTLRTLWPRRGPPHAAWIITPPESRPLLPSWFMVSGRPNHPMEAFHPAQTEGHPSRFVKPSYPQYCTSCWSVLASSVLI